MNASVGVKGMDVNCSVSVHALARHDRYRNRPWVVHEMTRIVNCNINHGENHTWLDELPVTVAKKIVKERLPHLLRTQRPAGGWKVKDAERVTYHILRGLEYVGLLSTMLDGGRFSHNPFALFQQSNSLYALLVRRDLQRQPLVHDDAAVNRMCEELFAEQKPNGSWNDSVISTAGKVERLLALGIGPEDTRLQRSARWVLSTCQEAAYRESPRFGGALVGHHIFTNPDRLVEFESARRDSPDASPCKSCCRHLALAQNGLGIRMLISLGHADDNRVLGACENLVELYEAFGGFCDTSIRRGFEARKEKAGAKGS